MAMNERPEHFEELLAEYVDRMLAGEQIDPVEVLVQHPDVGHELLECLESFVEVPRQDQPLLRRLGDFTLLREIGRGGMGVVYEARQESMDRRVALKILPAGVAADRTAFLRFLREAQTAGRLQHPTIASVHSMGVESDTPYFAMEFIEGETLAEIVSRRREGRPPLYTGAFSPEEPDLVYFGSVARAFATVAEGLYHAHREGVIHRDIKPSNIIVDRDGRLRLLDFGLAYLEDLGTLTLTGDVVGTPLYMSPEQARREAIPIDERTDIYSLGATLYEVLTLEPPFRGKDRDETLRRIVEYDPPSLRAREPRIPPDLETVVLKCLRKDPVQRYGTARAMAQDLERFAVGEPIEARPEGTWDRLRRRVRRRRVPIAVGFVFLVLVVLSSWLAYRGERESARADHEKAQADYPLAVLKLAGELAAAEFRLEEGVAARAGSIALPFGALTPVTEQDLRRIVEADALDSVRKAVEELEPLMAKLPDKRDGHYQLARAFNLLGDEDRAREAALRALEIDETLVPAKAILEPIAALVVAQGDGWVAQWVTARRAMGEKGAQARDWPTAERAYSALIDEAERGEEPYRGLLFEAYLGRGVARLEMKDCLGAGEDFSGAHHEVRSSLEPVLLLGKAYLVQKERVRAQSIFERALRAAPPSQRDETAIRVAMIHVTREEYRDALAWAQWIQDAGLRERLRSYLYLRLENWEAAVEAGRAAVDAEPRNTAGHVLVCSALLERSRAPPADCVEYIELLEAASRATKLEPDNRHLGFLLRMARERVRSYVQATSRRDSMMFQTGCFRTLVALAFALGVSPSIPVDGQEIFDDFVEDADPFDGEPLAWETGDFACCNAEVEQRPGEGLCLGAFDDDTPQFLITEQVFAGDVTAQMRVEVPARGEPQVSIHTDFFTGSTYNGWLEGDGANKTAWFGRFDPGNFAPGRVNRPLGFDPTGREIVLELRSRGELVEFRVWPADGERPADAHFQVRDNTYREGSVGIANGVTPTCIRWARIISTPPLPPFLRGDCNGDGEVNISDATCALDYLFAGAAEPGCLAALNVNGDEKVDIADPVSLLNFLFGGGPPISEPFPECGPGELEADAELGCEVGC